MNKYFPCSFSEGNGDWVDGIDMTTVDNFTDDVWLHNRSIEFRKKLLDNKDVNGVRSCPLFDI